jgi:hypothetical protein
MEFNEINQFHVAALTSALRRYISITVNSMDHLKDQLKKAVNDDEFGTISELGNNLEDADAKLKGIQRFYQFVQARMFVGQEVSDVDWHMMENDEDLDDALHDWMVWFANEAHKWEQGTNTKENAQLLVAAAQILSHVKAN